MSCYANVYLVVLVLATLLGVPKDSIQLCTSTPGLLNG